MPKKVMGSTASHLLYRFYHEMPHLDCSQLRLFRTRVMRISANSSFLEFEHFYHPSEFELDRVDCSFKSQLTTCLQEIQPNYNDALANAFDCEI